MKTTQEPARLVVLLSGNGTNLQSILDAVADSRLPACVTAVVSDRSQAYGLERARAANVPALAFPKLKQGDRRQYDRELAELVAGYQPDWVVLAGWMRLLSMEFLQRFPGRVVNIHPALPGAFPGTHSIERAFTAFQNGEIEQTGVMIHLVPDEGVDCGPVLAYREVPITAQDTLESLAEHVHEVEHSLYVETLKKLIHGEISPQGV